MIFDWFQEKKRKIGYEDILYILKYPDQYILINTLGSQDQSCLIKNTLSIENEISLLNKHVEQGNYKIQIIIYGLNNCDESVEKKYKQLNNLGFIDIHIYMGGMFEWLMLQDIYGVNEFPTTTKTNDLLKYRPKGIFHIPLLR